MRQPVHNSLVQFRANEELVSRLRSIARAQHKSPSEFMREVLREKTMEAA